VQVFTNGGCIALNKTGFIFFYRIYCDAPGAGDIIGKRNAVGLII